MERLISGFLSPYDRNMDFTFFFFSYVMKLGCPNSVEGVSGVEKRASAAWISYLGALGS